MPTEAEAAAAANPDPAAAAAAAPPPEPKWHEGERFAPHRDWLTAKGALVDDPLEALDKAARAGVGAEKFLGRNAETLMTKPTQGQPVAEWMRANAELFGLPESPDKYVLEKPQMAEGIEWDEGLAEAARKVGFENGVPPAALQALVGVYAERITAQVQGINDQMAAANTEMMAELERDWGAQTSAKIGQARLAAQALAQKAGLGADGQRALMSTLADTGGDAFVMKAMAALGEMMGEDSLAGHQAGTGGGVARTPAEAKARLAAMDSADGEYGKAYNSGNRVEMERLKPVREALLRLAAGS